MSVLMSSGITLAAPDSDTVLRGRVLEVSSRAQDQTIHYQIQRDRRLYSIDAPLIPMFRDYAAGEHKLILTTNQKIILEGLLGAKFCDNVCHEIIAAAVGRLNFREWTSEDDAVNEWLEDLYSNQRLENRSGEITYDMMRDGNHCVAVSFDNDKGNVCVYREPWWDGIEGVFIAYNAVDEPVYAVKDWLTETTDLGIVIRRVIYFEDRLERWISHSGGASWQAYVLPEDNNQWPIPWFDFEGKPLGIPYIHFRNGGRGTGNYGFSELTGGVLGFQDQINDLQYMASGGARYTGYKILTAAGITLKQDPNDADKSVLPDLGPGAFLWSSNADAKFGSIEPGNIDAIVNAYMLKLKAVARMTRTPLHTITGGDWPSGEALARAEQPAVDKATKQMEALTNAWAQVGRMAVRLQNRFGIDEKLDEDPKTAQIGCRFDPTERRDPLTRSTVVLNLRSTQMVGPVISAAEGMRIMGYDDQQVDDIQEEIAEEAMQAAQADAVRFSRGVGSGIGFNPAAAGTGGNTEGTDDEEVTPADPNTLPDILDTSNPAIPPTQVLVQ